MNESVLVPVPAHQVTRVWPQIEGLIQKALDRGQAHWHALDIYERLLLNQMHLWASKRDGEITACCVTQIVVYPRVRVLSVLVLSGGRESWFQFQEEVDAWARANGCQHIEGCGRKGWLKAAPEGWEFVHVIVRKKL